MITEKIIEDIAHSLGSDQRQVKIAIEQCRAKGVLTRYEVRQLERQGLPVSRVLRTILNKQPTGSVNIVLDGNHVTYDDLMCIIGIIAQDIKAQIHFR